MKPDLKSTTEVNLIEVNLIQVNLIQVNLIQVNLIQINITLLFEVFTDTLWYYNTPRVFTGPYDIVMHPSYLLCNSLCVIKHINKISIFCNFVEVTSMRNYINHSSIFFN